MAHVEFLCSFKISPLLFVPFWPKPFWLKTCHFHSKVEEDASLQSSVDSMGKGDCRGRGKCSILAQDLRYSSSPLWFSCRGTFCTSPLDPETSISYGYGYARLCWTGLGPGANVVEKYVLLHTSFLVTVISTVTDILQARLSGPGSRFAPWRSTRG